MGCTSSQQLDDQDEEIYVSNDDLGDAGVAVISPRIGPCTRIIDLQINGIGEEGITRLVNRLCSLSRVQLRTLRVSDNPIGVRGATELCKLLRAAPILSELSAKRCSMGEEGTAAFVNVIRPCGSLTLLDLQGNDMSRAVARKYADHLEQRPGLVIRHERVGNERAYSIAEQIEARKYPAKDIVLSDASISDDGAVVLATALDGNTEIARLELPRNNIGDEGVTVLCSSLNSCPSLTRINLAFNSLTKRGISQFAKLLHNNTSIRELDVTGNPGARELGNGRRDDIEYFLTYNQEQAKLAPEVTPGGETIVTPIDRIVVTSSNGPRSAGDEEADEFALESHSGVPDITMRHAHLSDYGATRLAKAACLGSSRLTHVLLDSNRFGDNGATALAEALTNTAVTCISLSANCIGDEGAGALGHCVKSSTRIKRLVLSKNFIRIPRVLCEAASGNSSLEVLDLENNDIGTKGAAYLKTLLAGHPMLSTLKLSHNLLGDEGTAQVGAGVARSKSIMRLTLASNQIFAKGLIGLSEGIKVCDTLRIVEIENNRLEDDGVIALSKAIVANRKLHSLDLHQTFFTDTAAHELSEALRVAKRLTNLRIPWDGLSRPIREDIRTTMLMNATNNPDIPARW